MYDSRTKLYFHGACARESRNVISEHHVLVDCNDAQSIEERVVKVGRSSGLGHRPSNSWRRVRGPLKFLARFATTAHLKPIWLSFTYKTVAETHFF
jgi:hypothetical protein